MADATRTTRFRFWLWLIHLIGVAVPRQLRANWRREWEAELRRREELLAEWDRLDWRNKLDLLRRSTSAFWDALWLQPKRLEDEMFQDLRYGVRMLTQGRGFTVAAVLCLALGIGVNTAIFSLASAALWRPLPVEQPAQLVEIIRGDGMNGNTLSYPDYLAISERNDTLPPRRGTRTGGLPTTGATRRRLARADCSYIRRTESADPRRAKRSASD
jgi:hypothetical protein